MVTPTSSSATTIGNLGTSGNSGAAFIFDGQATLGHATVASTSAVTTVTGQTNEAAGVVAAADIDGDGYADLAVGAQAAGAATLSGTTYLFKSRGTTGIASGATSTATTTLTGSTGSRFGASLSFGDVNGDGYADLLASGWGGFVSSTSYPGSAYVFTSQGSTGIASGGLASAATTITGATIQFAEWLTLGDVNGDGYDDAVMTNYFVNGTYPGALYVFQSAGAAGIPNGSDAHPTTLISGVAHTGLGSAVAVGDVNGDGYGDVITNSTAAVYVYASQPDGGGIPSGSYTSATTALTAPDASTGLAFGVAVSGLDVNGDGFGDVTATADSSNPGGTLYVFRSAGASGVASAAYTAASSAIPAPGGASQYGVAVAP